MYQRYRCIVTLTLQSRPKPDFKKDVSISVNFKEVEQTLVDRIKAHEELEAHGELKILNRHFRLAWME